MRTFLASMAVVAMISTASIAVNIATATEAFASCVKKDKRQKCGYNPDPGKQFSGDQHPTDMINVRVCHRYWARLNSPKWWGPTIQYGSWRADLPASHKECKNFTVKRGSVIDTYASCVRRVIRTVRMMKPGTYTLN